VREHHAPIDSDPDTSWAHHGRLRLERLARDAEQHGRLVGAQ
jgi:hypothetical protein